MWGVRHQRLIPALSPLPRLGRHHRTKWQSPTPFLAVSHSFKSRSSGGVRRLSSSSPSSQPSRRVATTQASPWPQRLPRFRLDRQARQARQKVPARRKATARRQAAARRKGSGSAKGGGSASTAANTATTQPSQLPVGGTASFSNGGSPEYDLTVTQFVDPAQPAKPHVIPKNPGDVFVAIGLTFKNVGTADVSQDIYNDTTLYDSTGQAYDGDFESTASGPDFPVGVISDRAGGTTTGWIMFEVPASSTGFTATFTPTEGVADQAAATWKLS